ncbi:tryptophan synthase subunit alpha [Staphylococcus borealis]|uniref:tryptophan synthase subunit alpha n=1 Tax=Staphylococcus borealis TaxID=2742203 RepID=UPI000D1FAB17|nr:tryptophan synthase subunit alpha [Staphylococcus borealis]PTK66951.1 tryptophan synthase subunit alpha [Staphylococcus borealis]RIO70757.1 tryptophan synthase subunit alpha [Staphylococcus borealis]
MTKLFIPYIMGNKSFIKNMKILDENGADIVEIGVPFSDPVADGPIIMEAGNHAIKEGVTIDYIFNELSNHKDEINCKYVLMTYYNIIVSYGEEAFFKQCANVGVYGVIIPDLPHELTQKLKAKIAKVNVKLISLVAMTADDERINKIVKQAEGFIYTVTMNATTGENGTFHPQLKDKLKLLKAHTDIPVVAGFGIRTIEHIKDIADVADGVVIGSEIVKRLSQDDNVDTIHFLKQVRETLDML